MKSFDEWFEENKKDGDVKWRLERAWQAAQEVQRESDAKINDSCSERVRHISEDEYMKMIYGNEYCNNKAV